MNSPTRLRARRLARLWLVFTLLLPGLSPAATCVWLGQVDEYWNNPANWTNGIMPEAGDTIEFVDGARFRDTHNDRGPDMSLKSIVFKGRNFSIRGYRINLGGNLVSIPGNSTNRVLLDLNVTAPASIFNYGYFNGLELAGRTTLYHPLVLQTSSTIVIRGRIMDTNHLGITLTGGGAFVMQEGSQLFGTIRLEHGNLVVGNFPVGFPRLIPLAGSFTIGQDGDFSGMSKLILLGRDRTGSGNEVTVKRSGVMVLDGSGLSEPLIASIGGLRGTGRVQLEHAHLNVHAWRSAADFSGEVHGNGELQVQGPHTLTLGGHSPFEGILRAWAGAVHLQGSVSNAAVHLHPTAVLSGSGVARSLTATNAVVRPGPGTLRFLEGFTLDVGTLLDVVLDGPDASMIQAGSINLGNAALQLTYHGVGLEDHFTLVSANSVVAGSLFNGLAEGAWLLAGDPAAPHEFKLTYAGGGGQDVKLERTGLFLPPMLSIHPLSATERRIEWPIAAQGYTLQHTPILHPPAWTANGLPAPAATATEHYVIDDTSPGQRFYRLTR